MQSQVAITMHVATEADATTVRDLVHAVDLADFGEADTTNLADVERWIRLATHAWLITTDTGQPISFAVLEDNHAGGLGGDIYTLPDYKRPEIGSQILQFVETRARELITAAPEGARVILTFGFNALNREDVRLFEQGGYTPERTFWRMRIDMMEPPPEPVWPEGVWLRSLTGTEEDYRLAYEAAMQSFQDHWGFVRRPFESWIKRTESTTHDAALWFLAMSGDQVAGFSLCANDPDSGWVETLGVLRGWRRQGLALALLYHSFGVFWRMGVTRVSLGVDAQSLTGATRLYTRAGMSVAQQYAVYGKELRPGRDLRVIEVASES